MSFGERFQFRFKEIVKPAIEAEAIAGKTLTAYRVDNAKTGDSILTDIVANIAHSRLILADVSVVDEGGYTGYPIRNGNVMYEVGMALACRLPSEVLLVPARPPRPNSPSCPCSTTDRVDCRYFPPGPRRGR